MPHAVYNVGVLALQGGFAPHMATIKRLGHRPLRVRYPDDLNQCDALVIPGGESTTMGIQAQRMELIDPITTFATTRPIFGTCAGVILMAHLGILTLQVKRNAYGRQTESFCDRIIFNDQSIPALFIRAPMIEDVGPQVTVLATLNEHPVYVSEGRHAATTFHPELTDDDTLYNDVLQRFFETDPRGAVDSNREPRHQKLLRSR